MSYNVKNPIGIFQGQRFKNDPSQNIYDLVNGYIEYNQNGNIIQKRQGLNMVGESPIEDLIDVNYGIVKGNYMFVSGYSSLYSLNNIIFQQIYGDPSFKRVTGGYGGYAYNFMSAVQSCIWNDGTRDCLIGIGKRNGVTEFVRLWEYTPGGWYMEPLTADSNMTTGNLTDCICNTHNNRLWIGFLGGDSAFGSNVRDATSATGFSGANDAIDYDFTYVSGDHGGLLGICGTGNFLVFFCKNKILVYSVTESYWTTEGIPGSGQGFVQTIDEGLFNQNCFWKIGNDIYYISSSGKIKTLSFALTTNRIEDTEINDPNISLWDKILYTKFNGYKKQNFLTMTYDKFTKCFIIISKKLDSNSESGYSFNDCILWSIQTKNIVGRYRFFDDDADSRKITYIMGGNENKRLYINAFDFDFVDDKLYSLAAFDNKGNNYIFDKNFNQGIYVKIYENLTNTVISDDLTEQEVTENIYMGQRETGETIVPVLTDDSLPVKMQLKLQTIGSDTPKYFKSIDDVLAVIEATTETILKMQASFHNVVSNKIQANIFAREYDIELLSGANTAQLYRILDRGRFINIEFTHEDAANIAISEIAVNTTVEGEE